MKTFFELDNSERLERILLITCNYFDVSIEEIKSDCRDRELIIPRRYYSYLGHTLTGAKWGNISKRLNRDRLTSYHHFNTISGFLEHGYKDVKLSIEDLHKEIVDEPYEPENEDKYYNDIHHLATIENTYFTTIMRRVANSKRIRTKIIDGKTCINVRDYRKYYPNTDFILNQ